MTGFDEAYQSLNKAQREAVDYIDGPLLVIAGPGTGKTQLLSARVANILQKTDTPAQNILCLTFTENGAENMRDRLSGFIGQAAYDVNISTYHAFGRELINRYPEYFTETRLQNAVDELGQRQIIADIVEKMHYANPLKQTRHHLNDLISTISEVKRALLSAEDLKVIAAENALFLRQASHDIAEVFTEFSRMPSYAKAAPLFEQVAQIIAAYAPQTSVSERFGSLASVALSSLESALQQASDTGKTTPLTTWKNDWLMKDENNHFVLAGELESKRVLALADVLNEYQAALDTRGLFDFDDMINRAIQALEQNDDLRFTLQERYLYILLDEFQDTNASQLRLVELLTNNPVNEGRPNVMAVGDDDQAIYAFQGAQYSNMVDFYHMYHDVRIVNLSENYRSHADILLTAENVARQIVDRLHGQFDGAEKNLVAANKKLPAKSDITRCEFLSDIAQADRVASDIKKLIARGVQPSEIAILAPKHSRLEPIVPYLNKLDIPVSYEKRENILDAPVVKQLLSMSQLILALHNGDDATADSLWPEVLSFDFWHIATSDIWDMSWQIDDARRQAMEQQHHSNGSWSRALLTDGTRFRIPALLFLKLATLAAQETCETMLDYLIGTAAVDTNEKDLPQVYSPLRDYYTSEQMREERPELFYETLSHLTVLRAKLREHQATSETALTLQDLIDFVAMYKEGDERMINTSPYSQRSEAVQMMTVFKAKGLEFEHVFLVSCQDDVWGSTSRGQSNRITLPANLAPIRHAGATDDERLRILYVAITRAKIGLHISSVVQNYNGKATKRLKYLDEQETVDGKVVDMILPEHSRVVQRDDTSPPPVELLELDWRKRHTVGVQQPDLHALLEPRLRTYQLSPTHLGSFLDLQYAGPERFFFSALLRFPEAPTTDSQFGNAIHETLQWVQFMVAERSHIPDTSEALEYFTVRMRSKKLVEARTALEIERGEAALAAYLAARRQQYKPTDKAEYSFKRENVFIGTAHLAGKVDRLEIDREHRTITVVDYKTGKSYAKWLMDPKLHKYQRQLYCYKLLVEHSTTFAGYTVTAGRLEFVEPNKSGRINVLDLAFDSTELEHTRKLLATMWQHVKDLNFPNTSSYDANLAGIKQFEDDLIAGRI